MSGMFFIWSDNFLFWSDIVRSPTIILRPVNNKDKYTFIFGYKIIYIDSPFNFKGGDILIHHKKPKARQVLEVRYIRKSSGSELNVWQKKLYVCAVHGSPA